MAYFFRPVHCYSKLLYLSSCQKEPIAIFLFGCARIITYMAGFQDIQNSVSESGYPMVFYRHTVFWKLFSRFNLFCFCLHLRQRALAPNQVAADYRHAFTLLLPVHGHQSAAYAVLLILWFLQGLLWTIVLYSSGLFIYYDANRNLLLRKAIFHRISS